ncbi:MAG: hypothetical protein VZR22_02960 [Candidatus Cryptobacteroides sp.]|nr:hypothetical protein [Candidatus Cryptobacteroides sp.]
MRFRGQGGVDGVNVNVNVDVEEEEEEDEDEDVKDGRKKVVQFGEID